MKAPFRTGTLMASIPVPRRRRPAPWPGRAPAATPARVGRVNVTVRVQGAREVARRMDDLHITLRVFVATARYRRRHPDAPEHHVLAARAAERVAAAYDIAVARLDTLQQRLDAHPTMEEAWNTPRSSATSTTSRSTATARKLWRRLRRRATTDA